MLPPIRLENVSSPLIPASKRTTKNAAEISVHGTKHFFEPRRELFALRNVALTAQQQPRAGDKVRLPKFDHGKTTGVSKLPRRAFAGGPLGSSWLGNVEIRRA